MRAYTILVVDDEPALRRVLRRALEQAGYTLHTAGSGEEACDVLRHHDVDAVLMDLRMPSMSGQTLYHVIASRWPHLAPRIIVMSGDPEAEDHAGWLALHNLPVLEKPFQVAQVIEAVRRLLASERHEANGS